MCSLLFLGHTIAFPAWPICPAVHRRSWLVKPWCPDNSITGFFSFFPAKNTHTKRRTHKNVQNHPTTKVFVSILARIPFFDAHCTAPEIAFPHFQGHIFFAARLLIISSDERSKSSYQLRVSVHLFDHLLHAAIKPQFFRHFF